MRAASENERESIATDLAPPPAGRYSQAIVAGGMLWIAGQTPRHPSGDRLNDEPFDAQARQALKNVAAIAAEAGTSLEQAVQVTVYLKDAANRFAFDEVWAEFVTTPYPARAVVQSDLPGFAIEIVAVCAMPSGGVTSL